MLGSFPSNIKKSIVSCCMGVVLVTNSFCEKEPDNEIPVASSPAYAEIESTIRRKYDGYAVFKWDQYTQLLDKLSQPKFAVLPVNEMRNTFDDSKVIVGLRHDVDLNPFKAFEMATIEKMYEIRASYYFLATAEYYGNITDKKMVRSPGIGDLIKEIYKTGAEIGIHNDLLTIMITYQIDPYLFNKEEIAFYKSLRIRINGTASHGSPVAKSTIPNYQIFSDFAKSDSVKYQGKSYPLGKHSLRDYGYKYEAYFIDHTIYLSDSGGKWNDAEGIAGILKKLDSSKPGERIQILVHPDWWGRK
jgi:hypothetical protein